ncbi:hypothetical protein EV13_0524 [Prochlorococcus sp. MIT 0702]|nr:hypothetical protein EV12_1727 [Prochlorococcus sp. MIT 0701]KGG30192.1 hypothetical protein EV13_0524 [Prochlorococcus sp. MIT 0702]KGG34989.1 hypothetical protein EV14_1033 [Prochlorococcus sp. MIT 0703]
MITSPKALGSRRWWISSHQSGLFDAANEMLQYQINKR